MIFATFSESGLPTGFYSEDVHGPRKLPVYGDPDENGDLPIVGERDNPACMIPREAIEISVEAWQEFRENQGQRRWDGSRPVPYTPEAPIATTEDVDAERDRRIASGFTFAGDFYQAREQDLRNINGAAIAATIAIVDGVLEGNLRWIDPQTDFKWIAADNSMVPMDAQTVIRFGQAALAWVSAMTMAGRSIKDRLLAGERLTITEDSLWPAPTP